MSDADYSKTEYFGFFVAACLLVTFLAALVGSVIQHERTDESLRREMKYLDAESERLTRQLRQCQMGSK